MNPRRTHGWAYPTDGGEGGDIEKLTIHHAFKMRAAHRKKFFSHGCSDKESKKRRRGPEERVENRWNVESEKLCRVRKEERDFFDSISSFSARGREDP